MNISKRKVERLIRDAFDAGRFATENADTERIYISLRVDYVRDEMDRLAQALPSQETKP